jgi:hypothetical protein
VAEEYRHVEAFCLMRYMAEDGSNEEEVIWNSRDGVTPFTISLRSGKTAVHVDWRKDKRAVDYVPPAGSRMFVDLTPGRAREHAEENLRRWEEDGTAKKYGPLPSVEELVAEYLRMPGQPDLVEVPTE